MNGAADEPLRVRVPAAIAAVMIVSSPLVQGGTPRLGVFLLSTLAALLLCAVLAWSPRGGCALLVGPEEGVLWMLVLLAGLHLPLVPYYHDAERAFLLIATFVLVFSLLLRLPGTGADRVTLGALLASAGLQGALATVQAANGLYQPVGTFDNPNFLAGLLAAAAGILLARALGLWGAAGPGATGRRSRLLALAGSLLFLAVLLRVRSRGGVLALGVTVTILLVMRYGRRALLLAAAGGAALLLVPNPFRERLFSLGSGDTYAFSRLDMWRSALSMIGDHPLLGVGLGQYEQVAARYAFPVRHYWARYAKITDNPHSEPLQLVAELGIPGLLLLAALLFFIWRRLARSPGPPAPRAWQPAVLAGMGAQAAVDFSLHSPPLVLAALVLAAAWLRENRVPDREGAAVQLRLLRYFGWAAAVLLVVLALRPLAGFVSFLQAGGGPVNLLDEKKALAAWGTHGKTNERLLRRAIRWDDSSAPYHSALGSLLARRYAATGERRLLEEGRRELDAAIALNPHGGRYLVHRADLLLSLARRGEIPAAEGRDLAIEAFRAALEHAPADVFTRERLAVQELEAGRPAQAEREFQLATRLEPCFIKAWYGRAVALEMQGRRPEAEAARLEAEERRRTCGAYLPLNGYESGLIDASGLPVHTSGQSAGRQPAGQSGTARR